MRRDPTPRAQRSLADAARVPRLSEGTVAARHGHDWAYDVVREAVSGGHRAFGQAWHAGGVGERVLRTRRWIAAHDRSLRGALIG